MASMYVCLKRRSLGGFEADVVSVQVILANLRLTRFVNLSGAVYTPSCAYSAPLILISVPSPHIPFARGSTEGPGCFEEAGFHNV